MPRRIFYSVDLAAWVYGTIEKLRPDVSWRPAWVEIYREIGGVSTSSGQKSCPMMAARTLYEFGRLKDGGLLFRDCDVSELWDHPGYGRNGAYAILATRLLRKDPKLKRKARGQR